VIVYAANSATLVVPEGSISRFPDAARQVFFASCDCRLRCNTLSDTFPQFMQRHARSLDLDHRDFLLRSRVAKAWELLASPRVTVSEVAFAVGFNDLSYFTRIFRRYTGVSASEYRKASVQRVAETGSVFRPSGSEMPTSSLHPCL